MGLDQDAATIMWLAFVGIGVFLMIITSTQNTKWIKFVNGKEHTVFNKIINDEHWDGKNLILIFSKPTHLRPLIKTQLCRTVNHHYILMKLELSPADETIDILYYKVITEDEAKFFIKDEITLYYKTFGKPNKA